ncbi:hypothetical protein K3495_g13827 [Podosphaera aphanis]|nr:hypothetical protein K3495_g13827 [Podosphaera aphanis]
MADQNQIAEAPIHDLPAQQDAPPAETPGEPTQNARPTVQILKDPAPPVVLFKPMTLPQYDGNTKAYPVWRKTVLDIFRMDWHAFGYTDSRAFLMIFNALKGKARDTAAAFYEAGGINGSNRPEDFLAYLDRCNLDVTRRQKALEQILFGMKMREGQEWLSFFPSWINKFIEAEGQEWGDAFKITTLRRCLTYDLQLRLVSVDTPRDDFDGYVRVVGQVAQQVEEFEMVSRRREREDRGIDR